MLYHVRDTISSICVVGDYLSGKKKNRVTKLDVIKCYEKLIFKVVRMYTYEGTVKYNRLKKLHSSPRVSSKELAKLPTEIEKHRMRVLNIFSPLGLE